MALAHSQENEYFVLCAEFWRYKNSVFSVHDSFLSPKMNSISQSARARLGVTLFLLRQLGIFYLFFHFLFFYLLIALTSFVPPFCYNEPVHVFAPN